MKTVSLELAKQLKEAGYPQDVCHLGSWYYQGAPNEIEKEKGYVLLMHNNLLAARELIKVLAPTFDEIVDVLPREIKKNHSVYWLCIEPANHLEEISSELKGFAVGYRNSKEWIAPFFEASLIADAAAKMYLYLKKERLL